MARFVKLTGKDGRPVHANLELVERITADRGGNSVLTFLKMQGMGADSVTVQETPDEIIARLNRLG